MSTVDGEVWAMNVAAVSGMSCEVSVLVHQSVTVLLHGDRTWLARLRFGRWQLFLHETSDR
jgi:hypothetical protein